MPLLPVLDDYRLIFHELQIRGIVRAKSINQLVAVVPMTATTLSPEEQETLNHVWARFRNRLNSIVRDSHEEIAWKKTGHAELISFILVK